jgi:hypothetical protein
LAQNDYQTFGDSGTDGTNKLSLTNYIADNDRIYGNGYTTKLLRSQLVNKVLQQTSKISSAVAQFLVNNGISALDTDSSSVIATNINNALNASRNTATHAATSKTTPVSADEIAILDSASSFSLKKITWGTFASIFAPLSSPSLTGTPTAPTATAGTNTTQIATTAMVHSAIVNDLNVTGAAPMYACRAWVNYNGSSPAIRASGNVSSVTKNGTGNYTINFSTAMPDANYTGVVSAGSDSTTGSCRVGWCYTYQSSSVIIGLSDNNNDASLDASLINIAIFR